MNTPRTANNEIPAGKGRLEDVQRLLTMWFPGDALEAIQTASADESEDGYLRFNLVMSYGSGEHRIQYAKGQSYKSFCEGEIGRDLGHIEQAHHIRCALLRLLETAEFKSERCIAAKVALQKQIRELPLMGWWIAAK